MKLIVLLLSSAACCMAAPLFDDAELTKLWNEFQKVYEKTYASVEEGTIRRFIWENNLQLIETHNLEADLGLLSFRLGMNEHGDLTNEEFTKTRNGYRSGNRTSTTSFLPLKNVVLPSEVDWRTEGYVTPVKNQGSCGSCWAFSTTGSLEGQTFRKTGQLVSLSEQNLVDCSRKEGNYGCKGGLMNNAFAYIKLNGGIDTEASYPYVGKDQQCRFTEGGVGGEDTGFVDVRSGCEKQLKQAVATVGPVSVAIDASSIRFQFYRSGIYVDRTCSTKRLDHGVLAVGYGTDNGKDYWLVKNSWGESWGKKGYIKMARNRKNMCGIATSASYPLV